MPNLLELFFTFLKIGLFTFGGGYGMIPIVKQEVINHGWMSESELLNIIGISESTPGPIAVNMATFVGSTQGGILGSILATIGVVLPAFCIMLMIVAILKNFIKNPYVSAFLSGVRPVVVALILSTGLMLVLDLILGDVSKHKLVFDYKALIIFVILAIAMFVSKKVFKKNIPPILLILISALLGMGIYAIN